MSTARPLDFDAVKSLVDDLRSPKPRVFFADLLLSAALGWLAFAYAGRGALDVTSMLALWVAILALYRGLAFIHEIFHQQAMTGFRALWHALIGIPLLIPFLMYLPVHQGHHNSRTYGTRLDGEYDQFLGRFASASVRLFALNLALPFALWIRFALLVPLAWLFPSVRERVIPGFVHMALRMPYVAPALKGRMQEEALLIEWLCMVWAWFLLGSVWLDGGRILACWGLLVVVIATLNTLRALCATHLYVESEQGRGAVGQLNDSLNIANAGLLTQLLCPVGLRFHALHHIAPYLPYHALAEAHQRLISGLPSDSDYHRATVASLAEGLSRLRRATALAV